MTRLRHEDTLAVMAGPELSYEPSGQARPVVVEHDGDITRITVLMPGIYAPVPKELSNLDILALVVVPVWWLASLLFRTILQLPKPARAVFEISRDRFKMRLCDPGTGERKSFDWPRSAVLEARANRYERGLWLNVPGQVKDSFLIDLPRSTIDRVEAALALAQNRVDQFNAEQGASESPP